jgi:ferritin-like metal-binding protein YciE
MSNTSTNNSNISNDNNKRAAMKSSQLMQLFETSLKDIYWAEKALTKAIPRMIEKATDEDLGWALTKHLAETEEQIIRLEDVFSLIEVEAKAEKCEAMAGLIKEAEDIMDHCEEGAMRDAGIIAAAQKIEHYEIATYGTLKQFAVTLQLNEVVNLLDLTFEEEIASDEKLSEVAMDAINIEAAETTEV